MTTADRGARDGGPDSDPASPLTVLLVGDPRALVGPDAEGDASQILSILDQALVAAGHRSLVIAPDGSVCRGRLLATPARRSRRAAITRALRDHVIDLVHFHGTDFDRCLPDPGPPVLVTLHQPPAFYAPSVFRIERPATFLHGVSASQAASLPDDAFLLPAIPNGVALDRARFRAQKHAFVLALGDVSAERGHHLAIAAAARAATTLLLAGRVLPGAAHARYFREAIAPRLGRGARFLGPAAGARRRRLLAGARCLLVPSLVADASSLVAMEALASGTPAIALRRGALPEIIEHGVTGFIVDDVEEMADAIRAADSLDPLACRRAAEERFSAARMTRVYLETYARVVRASRCASRITTVIEPRGRAPGA